MAANTAPIFTKYGLVGRGVKFSTAASGDFMGVNIETREVWGGDEINGSFIERLRFKALGTNIQTVARIFINNGNRNVNWGSTPGAPTGSASASGGSMLNGTYYAKVIAIGAHGAQTPLGSQSSGVVISGSASGTGKIVWSWTPIVGSETYRLYVSDVSGIQTRYFAIDTPTPSFTQTLMPAEGINDDPYSGNQFLYGEITLPATTISHNSATPDIDYYMNIALPPGYEVYCQLGTAVAAGWEVSSIGGVY